MIIKSSLLFIGFNCLGGPPQFDEFFSSNAPVFSLLPSLSALYYMVHSAGCSTLNTLQSSNGFAQWQKLMYIVSKGDPY